MCDSNLFFELYMYNSVFFRVIHLHAKLHFFELYMYNCITPCFLSDTFRYISIHSTFSLFLNLPLGKRLHFSSFHGWVLNCIFFRHRFSEIKAVILENQPTTYLPLLFFFLLPFWPIWNFFPSLPCWSSFFGLILHTLHWLQDFVIRRARCGHSRSLRRIIQMWSRVYWVTKTFYWVTKTFYWVTKTCYSVTKTCYWVTMLLGN